MMRQQQFVNESNQKKYPLETGKELVLCILATVHNIHFEGHQVQCRGHQGQYRGHQGQYRGHQGQYRGHQGQFDWEIVYLQANAHMIHMIWYLHFAIHNAIQMSRPFCLKGKENPRLKYSWEDRL